MHDNSESGIQPIMQFSVTIKYDLWKKMESIKRAEGIPKAYMVSEGLRLWFEQREFGKAS